MRLRNVTQTRTVTDPPKPTKEGDLIVWVVINPPSPASYYAVDSPEEAGHTIEYLANEQLKDDRIVANAFGLMRAEPKIIEKKDVLCRNGVRVEQSTELEWVDWYDDDGNDIDEYFENVLRGVAEKAADGSCPVDLELED